MRDFLVSMKNAEEAYKKEKHGIMAEMKEISSHFSKAHGRYEDPQITSIREINHGERDTSDKPFVRKHYKTRSIHF